MTVWLPGHTSTRLLRYAEVREVDYTVQQPNFASFA
jgi:hypothetical protein